MVPFVFVVRGGDCVERYDLNAALLSVISIRCMTKLSQALLLKYSNVTRGMSTVILR